MILEIWILEKDIEQLKKLITSWLSCKGKQDQAIRYYTSEPKMAKEWICVHISLDNYTILTDHNLLIKR